jgi:hypothetical protein
MPLRIVPFVTLNLATQGQSPRRFIAYTSLPIDAYAGYISPSTSPIQ